MLLPTNMTASRIFKKTLRIVVASAGPQSVPFELATLIPLPLIVPSVKDDGIP